MKNVTVWFDFISPFSYLAQQQLNGLSEEIELNYRPVLFAGLLKHWGTKGPAEVAPRRLFTYRYAHWLARREGIPYRTPPAHPFNPLPALRASIALKNSPQAVNAIFDFIWAKGLLPEGKPWKQLLLELGLTQEMLQTPSVKQQLHKNTDAAIAIGVFGVPSFSVALGNQNELFWGQDALPMLLDYLRAPDLFDGAEYSRITSLPLAAERVLKPASKA